MIPFQVQFKTGVPVYEQVIYAVEKALLSGQLKAGDAFPSVRVLSRELKINPNTAHKIVTRLKSDGVLEVVPGIGTVVSRDRLPQPGDRARLLGEKVEALVVEAKKLNLELEAVEAAVREHWEKI